MLAYRRLRIPISVVLVLVTSGLSFTLTAQSPLAVDTTQLKVMAKGAKSQGLIDQEAALLCQAASQDPAHFQKHCDDARAEATRLLGQFDGYFGTARFEFAHQDYPGAVRDLSRITFGPHLAEAHHLIAEAHAIENAGGLDSLSAAALRAARARYDQGDFAGAIAAAQSVQTASLGPSAQQILHNIQLFRDTMVEGDALAAAGNYGAAEDKYKFALQIKANGPGDPAGKLAAAGKAFAAQQEQRAAAERAAAAQTAAKPSIPESAAPPDPHLARLLARAVREERENKPHAALNDYNAVLARSPANTVADEGKRRVEVHLRSAQTGALTGPVATASAARVGASDDAQGADAGSSSVLRAAVDAFYAGHFASAADQFSTYLRADPTDHQGAAHFYLAASLVAQALLADPTSQSVPQPSEATQQFRLANQAGYHPVTSLVSPRILAAWKEAATAQ